MSLMGRGPSDTAGALRLMDELPRALERHIALRREAPARSLAQLLGLD